VAQHLPSELNEDTRLVTLTVGGNDLGFRCPGRDMYYC